MLLSSYGIREYVGVLSGSVGVKSGLARHGRAIVSIILFQSLLILWLATWAIEDYVNNQYVRAYVDGTLQSDGWIFGTVGFLVILGSVLGLIMHRRRSATLELVNTGTKIPISTPVTRSANSPTPIGRVSAPSTSPMVTTVTSTGSTVTAPKATVEFHPAVAALKAELSDARMSLGLASVTANQSTPVPTTTATRFEDQRPLGPPQQVLQLAQSQPQVPRPTTSMSGNVPMTVIRPTANPPPTSQSQSTGIRLTPSTVIHPMLPAASSPHSQQSPAMPKAEERSSTAPAMPMGPRPGTSQQSQIDISTVITGIVPDPKKKDPNSQNAQNSQQN